MRHSSSPETLMTMAREPDTFNFGWSISKSTNSVGVDLEGVALTLGDGASSGAGAAFPRRERFTFRRGVASAGFFFAPIFEVAVGLFDSASAGGAVSTASFSEDGPVGVLVGD